MAKITKIIPIVITVFLLSLPSAGVYAQALQTPNTPQTKQVQASVWQKIISVLEKGVTEDVDFFQDPTQEDRDYLKTVVTALKADPDGAKKLLKERAETGNANFQHIMSIFLTAENKQKALNRKNYSHEESIYWAKEAALHGHYRAQYLLGFIYGRAQDGKIRPNYEEAKKWFEMAAQNKHSMKGEPEYQLAMLYEAGFLQPETKAIEYYLLAAEKGSEKAQTEVGFFYETGKYVEKDHDKAIYWIEKAAEQGVSVAQYNMANFYKMGKIGDGSPNYPLFVEWATKAAEQGHNDATYELGLLYFRGAPGYPSDHQKAIDYFRRSALRNHGISQYMYGSMNEKGVATPVNKTQAYLYYSLSFQNGFVQGRKHLKDLKQNMTEVEIEQAENMLNALKSAKASQK